VKAALLFPFDTQPQNTQLIITRTRATGLDMRSLARFMSRARRQIGVKGEVNVLLTSSTEMRRLNLQYRKKNAPTDVLSFPAPESNGLAGDIAISLDIARRSSEERNETWEDEVRILILHGLLHLAGYDHEKDNGVMERNEQRLRTSLGLSSSLIERNQNFKPGKRMSKKPQRRQRPSPPKTKSKAGQL